MPSTLTRPSSVSEPDDATLRLLLRSVRDYAIFTLDPKGHITSWNTGAELLKGYRAPEILGRHFSVFYPQEALARGWPARELEIATAEGRVEDQGWRLRKDGTRFWANVVISALRDERGELRGFAKVTRDLTERRAQDEALRRSEERFRLLIERVEDYAIFMLDPQGHIASWNAGARRIKGYEAEEVLGRHFSMFYPSDAVTAGWPDAELAQARRNGRFEDEGWRLRKDGTRFWANVVITALTDEQGEVRGFAKVTRDLSERRMVAALEERARHMNEFIAMLSHELRNPLAPIRHAAALLPRAADDPERVRWAASVIDRQAAVLSRLVDDLLDVSRITAGKLVLQRTRVDLAEACARAVETLGPVLESGGQRLEVALDRPVPVYGDEVRLVQVVSNLLHNAAKFTPAGGRIGLRLIRERTHASLVVEDDGSGMTPELLARIFDLFAQGGQEHGQSGLGLGLTIVRRLVELHGGRIRAESEGPGRGSRFTVELPVLAEGLLGG